MAAPPVFPPDLKAQLVAPGDRACDYLTKGAAFDKLVFQLFDWMLKDDGTAEQGFLDWLGAVGGGGTTGFPAPANVQASENFPDKIQVTWSSVSGATAYKIFRGTTADTSLMAEVTPTTGVTGNSWDDAAATGVVAGTTYYYAMKAFNPTQTSAFSLVDSGKMGTATDPLNFYSPNIAQQFTVPPNVSKMVAELWGAGGQGGSSRVGVWTGGGSVPPGEVANYYPGGGGASGGYYHVINVPVIPGDIWKVWVGGSVPRSDTYIENPKGKRVSARTGGAGGAGGAETYNPATETPKASGQVGTPASPLGSNDFGPLPAESDSMPGVPGDAGIGGSPQGPSGDGRGGDGAPGNLVIDVGDDSNGGPGGPGRVRVAFSP